MNINLLPNKFIRNRAFEVILSVSLLLSLVVVGVCGLGFWYYQRLVTNNQSNIMSSAKFLVSGSRTSRIVCLDSWAAAKTKTYGREFLARHHPFLALYPFATFIDFSDLAPVSRRRPNVEQRHGSQWI